MSYMYQSNNKYYKNNKILKKLIIVNIFVL